MSDEKFIFDSFCKALPDFADEAIKEWDVVKEWYVNRNLEPPVPPFNDRPDVICVTVSGKRLGTELKSWLDEDQIAEAKKQEKIRETILAAIGEQPPNETKNIGYVWLSPKQTRFQEADANEFRQQMFALIDQIDKHWSKKDKWDQECSEDVTEFENFQTLSKYIDRARFHPVRRGRRNKRWVCFPSPGGAYDPMEMLGPLTEVLFAVRQDERYRDLKQAVGLDEAYLLVHYDFNAFAYNDPFGTPDFGFKEAADFARKKLAGNAGHFDRIFLFHCLQDEEEVYRIA